MHREIYYYICQLFDILILIGGEKMSIGNNIRNIRKKNGMTLKQIADIIGCSPQLISQYESGKRQPKLETKKSE